MSKTINNYRGRHHGWKQSKTPKARKLSGVKMTKDGPRPTVPPIQVMWMNYIVKSKAFQKTRNACRDMLNIKGKKALTGAKRQKVLDKFFAVAY